MYKYIYFDLDRTLWDFETNSKQTLNEIYQDFKLNEHFPSFEMFYKTYYQINDKLWDLYRRGRIKKEKLRTERFFLTLKTVNLIDSKLTSKIDEYYINESPQKTNLFPYSIEILSYLKSKDYILAILTNGFKEVQNKKLKNCNIDHYFSKIISSEDVGYQKPRPEIFHYAISSLNAKKSQSIMIGDDFENDILGACNYGIDTIFVNFNKLKKNNVPKYEVYSLKEIENIL